MSEVFAKYAMDHIVNLGGELLYLHYLDSIKPEYEFNFSMSSVYTTALIGSCLPDPGESRSHV